MSGQSTNQPETKVLLHTSMGDIIIALRNDMPITTGNFKNLVQKGTFNGTIFHRVIPGFMIQGGDPTGTGSGGPGYSIPDEISSRKHIAGTLSMANAGPNTNGSQFFVCYSPQSSLDGHYSVFGQLTQGTDVLNKIKLGDALTKVTVEEK